MNVFGILFLVFESCILWSHANMTLGHRIISTASTIEVTIDTNYTMATSAPKENIKRTTLSPEQRELQRVSKESFYQDYILRGISQICGAVSLFLLMALKLPFSVKFFIHKHLVACYLVTNFLFFIQHDDILIKYIQIRKLCTASSIVNYYMNTAIFTWMLSEGINICIKLNSVFDTMSNTNSKILYSAIGWGIPTVIYGILVPIFSEQINSTQRCAGVGDKTQMVDGKIVIKYYSWIYKGPVGLILFLNTLCFMFILFIVIKSVCSKKRRDGKVKKLATTIRSVIAIYPLLGFSFFLGFFANKKIVVKIFPYFNGTPGIFFFIFHVVLDDQVRVAFVKQVFSRETSRKMLKSKKSQITTAKTNSSAMKSSTKNGKTAFETTSKSQDSLGYDNKGTTPETENHLKHTSPQDFDDILRPPSYTSLEVNNTDVSVEFNDNTQISYHGSRSETNNDDNPVGENH